jgi:hypothetical protein
VIPWVVGMEPQELDLVCGDAISLEWDEGLANVWQDNLGEWP